MRLFFTVLAFPALVGAQTAAEQYKAGRAAMSVNNAEMAIRAFERAAELDDRNAEYHLWLGRAVGSRALVASKFQQPFLARRAKSEFERAVQLDPSSVGGREGLLQFYLNAPGVMGGSLEKARQQAAEIGKVNTLRGHLASANIANREKEHTAAEREYRAAVTDAPDSSVASVALANYLQSSGRSDEAFATIDRALARHPADPALLFGVGRLAAASGRQLDRGEQALRRLLASGPADTAGAGLPAPAVLHFRLGELLVKKGQKNQARKEFETALDLNPRMDAARKALVAISLM
jgi:tetratricopeptide (TPR) repeat protein